MVAVRQAGGPYGQGNFRFTWQGARVQVKIDAAVGNALDQTAAAAKAAAIERAPVGPDHTDGTPHLYETIDADVEVHGGRREIVMSASAPYAAFVELGTSRMAAQPYLRPAIDQEAPRLTERIRAALRSG